MANVHFGGIKIRNLYKIFGANGSNYIDAVQKA